MMTGHGGTRIIRYTSDAAADTGDGTRYHTSDGRVWYPIQVPGNRPATGETYGTKVGDVIYEKVTI